MNRLHNFSPIYKNDFIDCLYNISNLWCILNCWYLMYSSSYLSTLIQSCLWRKRWSWKWWYWVPVGSFSHCLHHPTGYWNGFTFGPNFDTVLLYDMTNVFRTIRQNFYKRVFLQITFRSFANVNHRYLDSRTK